MNAYAERWVRSVKAECLSKLILFGEQDLRRALREYLAHYHQERNHQGMNGQILCPSDLYNPELTMNEIQCHSRLGGLLKYYYRSKKNECDDKFTDFVPQHAGFVA